MAMIGDEPQPNAEGTPAASRSPLWSPTGDFNSPTDPADDGRAGNGGWTIGTAAHRLGINGPDVPAALRFAPDGPEVDFATPDRMGHGGGGGRSVGVGATSSTDGRSPLQQMAGPPPADCVPGLLGDDAGGGDGWGDVPQGFDDGPSPLDME